MSLAVHAAAVVCQLPEGGGPSVRASTRDDDTKGKSLELCDIAFILQSTTSVLRRPNLREILTTYGATLRQNNAAKKGNDMKGILPLRRRR